MPDDKTNQWFDRLLEFADELPQAGMVACDLLYPLQRPDGAWLVQCAGGYFNEGKLGYIGGGVDVEKQIISNAARVYGDDLKQVRRVQWVTFGGVYIRRDVLDACGGFDRRYQWAYVMDVDYCMEARMRGFEVFQVPVNLTHFEARTTRVFRTPERHSQVEQNYQAFYEKWAWWLGSDGLGFNVVP